MDNILWDECVQIANDTADGHLTLFKFTTNWRFMLGTPFGREDIENAFSGKTADDAMLNFLNHYHTTKSCC